MLDKEFNPHEVNLVENVEESMENMEVEVDNEEYLELKEVEENI